MVREEAWRRVQRRGALHEQRARFRWARRYHTLFATLHRAFAWAGFPVNLLCPTAFRWTCAAFELAQREHAVLMRRDGETGSGRAVHGDMGASDDV